MRNEGDQKLFSFNLVVRSRRLRLVVSFVKASKTRGKTLICQFLIWVSSSFSNSQLRLRRCFDGEEHEGEQRIMKH